MQVVLAIAAGLLFGFGVYMLLRRSVIKILFAFILLSAGANLLIFGSSQLARGRAPIAVAGESAPAAPVSDPLAQALILTAIVISFGVLAFAMVVVRRLYDALGDDDVDRISELAEEEAETDEARPEEARA